MDYEIFYSPHRIQVTAVGNTSPFTMRYQFMPLYGPQRWYDFEPQTQLFRDAAPDKQEGK